MSEVVNLITDEMETQGSIEFVIQDEDFFNQDIKEFAVFYKIVGESRMKVFRNNSMELVFVRLNDDWMRQSKVDINGVLAPLQVKLKWDNQSEDELAVKKPGDTEFITVGSIQIDN